MASLIFVTLAYPGRPLSRILLLLNSLRRFGGCWAASPFWVLHPQSLGSFTPDQLTRLEKLGGKALPFKADEEILRFPLGLKVQAAAAAEALAQGTADQLVWLDEDTLVLSSLEEFTLTREKVLAYRPVHHKLLGTAWGTAPDPFWELVYQRCGAAPAADFKMTTHVGEEIRPYFNAGCYAVKPGEGILGKWEQFFKSCYRDPDFARYYEEQGLYAVFMHQAVFTGVILAELKENALQALSPVINYPLHLHQDIPPALQAGRIDDLVTARYEDLLDKPGWQAGFNLSRELETWIEDQRVHNFLSGESS